MADSMGKAPRWGISKVVRPFALMVGVLPLPFPKAKAHYFRAKEVDPGRPHARPLEIPPVEQGLEEDEYAEGSEETPTSEVRDPNPEYPTSEEMLVTWHRGRFGDLNPRAIGVDLSYASDEVCRTLTKISEDRATPEDLYEGMADVLVVLAVLAGSEGWTMSELFSSGVRRVIER